MLQSMRTIPFLRNFSSKMPKSSRGFTLVELLVVILIIGILGAMMMLLGGSVVDKARTTRIVSEMKIMKSAGQFYFCDYGSWPIWAYNEGMGSYRNLSPREMGLSQISMWTSFPLTKTTGSALCTAPMKREKHESSLSSTTEECTGEPRKNLLKWPRKCNSTPNPMQVIPLQTCTFSPKRTIILCGSCSCSEKAPG